LSRLTQIAPPCTRFVFLGAGIRLGLPSHPASRRRSCLRLGVSTTSSSRGLSPPSDRPCRAYSRRRLRRRWPGVSVGLRPWGGPGRRTPGHTRRAHGPSPLTRHASVQRTAIFLVSQCVQLAATASRVPSGVADGDRHSPTLDSAVVRMVQGGCEEERWSAGAGSGVGPHTCISALMYLAGRCGLRK